MKRKQIGFNGNGKIPPLPRKEQEPEPVDALTAAAGEEPLAGETLPATLSPDYVRARLKSERVEEALKAMQGWKAAPGTRAINRVKSFPTSDVARLYSSFVTGLAGALKLPVAVHVWEGHVVVTLHAPRSHGRIGPLTEEVLGFGKLLG
jgi:hypothetical protein